MNFVAADWGPSECPSPDSLALSSEPGPPGPRSACGSCDGPIPPGPMFRRPPGPAIQLDLSPCGN
eukprot:351608-Hanusia_phi.AAC.1